MSPHEPRHVVLLVLGVALIVAGVLLWLTFDRSWFGIVSGIGVVVLYPIVGPRIEAWRARDRS